MLSAGLGLLISRIYGKLKWWLLPTNSSDVINFGGGMHAVRELTGGG